MKKKEKRGDFHQKKEIKGISSKKRKKQEKKGKKEWLDTLVILKKIITDY